MAVTSKAALLIVGLTSISAPQTEKSVGFGKNKDLL